MVYTQIKIIMLSFLLGISASTYCLNTFLIENNTDGEIVVMVGSGFCRSTKHSIQAHDKMNIVMACCLQGIGISATTGIARGQFYAIDTAQIKSKNSCPSFYIKVYISAANTLLAEAHSSSE
jgi:hypothetical protein